MKAIVKNGNRRRQWRCFLWPVSYCSSGCTTTSVSSATPGTAAFSYDRAALPGRSPGRRETSRTIPTTSSSSSSVTEPEAPTCRSTFKLAMGQLNLLQPEFVINVGDMIEGYSDDKAELNAEWDEVDRC